MVLQVLIQDHDMICDCYIVQSKSVSDVFRLAFFVCTCSLDNHLVVSSMRTPFSSDNP